MSCKNPTRTYGPIPAWTKKSDTNWLFHPMSGPLDSTGLNKLRVSYEMRQNSGAAEIRPALRMSNDTQQWDTPVAIGTTTRTTEGVTYGDDYVDMSTTTKAKTFAQLGIECKNDSGAGPEMCMAALKVDIKEV